MTYYTQAQLRALVLLDRKGSEAEREARAKARHEAGEKVDNRKAAAAQRRAGYDVDA